MRNNMCFHFIGLWVFLETLTDFASAPEQREMWSRCQADAKGAGHQSTFYNWMQEPWSLENWERSLLGCPNHTPFGLSMCSDSHRGGAKSE
jgi:hypothetical protein